MSGGEMNRRRRCHNSGPSTVARKRSAPPLRMTPWLVIVLLLFAASSTFASTVVKIRVDDTIQPISAEYVERAIEHARQTNADVVLIELTTPGGLATSTREMIQ